MMTSIRLAVLALALATPAFADLPPIGKPAQPVTIVPTGLANIEQLDFANGVRAQIWPTSDEPSCTRISSRRRFGPTVTMSMKSISDGRNDSAAIRLPLSL